MIAFAVRAALSGLIVAAGALVASLPLVSLLGMIWLWRDTGDTVRLADHAEATFWYVMPSLPMFLIVPTLLRHGIGFWSELVADCGVTILLYLALIPVAARFGVTL